MAKSTESISSPPEAMLARGVKIKIKDLDDVTEPTGSMLDPYHKGKLTNFEVAVKDDKSIVVPSFGTISVLFTRHLNTLR